MAEVHAGMGVHRADGQMYYAVEVTMGGRLWRDVWEHPNTPPQGVDIPDVFVVELIDHSGIPLVDGEPQVGDDDVYLVCVVDGAQTGSGNLIPTLVAWSAALEASES